MTLLMLLSVAVMAVVVAAVEPASTPAPAAEGDTSNVLLGKSVVASLLVATGFSEACVAEALDSCAPASVQSPTPPNPLVQEARELLQEVRQVVRHYDNRPRHCKDLLDGGDSGKGLRHVYPFPGQPQRRAAVYCDQTTDGGGWTVFQRRTNLTVREDFNRTWRECDLGFGHLEGEFWLGLDLLHGLTSTALQELRIDMADWDDGKRYAKYGFFYVGPPSTKYRLTVDRYSGDAGDSLARSSGRSFTTHDADNDSWATRNCAEAYGGPWWYRDCSNARLNGLPHYGHHEGYTGILWLAWRGNRYSLRQTVMMTRPAF
ncbi:fibrinogen C domain-containing protein 1-like isoform X1 [Eriocheir sinensis]|uniref:fibrinogen C domain-containing protein 1-like isoform X1 n=2 Tax=Eriocheir sinensis TaxID=95602 RepID=UPI0021C737A9|nr:fibrinogen C domain-containing protein 1-like isoform X1 [Eriocheir sinensis]